MGWKSCRLPLHIPRWWLTIHLLVLMAKRRRRQKLCSRFDTTLYHYLLQGVAHLLLVPIPFSSSVQFSEWEMDSGFSAECRLYHSHGSGLRGWLGDWLTESATTTTTIAAQRLPWADKRCCWRVTDRVRWEYTSRSDFSRVLRTRFRDW